MIGPRWFWTVATGFALATCSPGDRGMLTPVASAGVTLASTHGLPNDTARLNAGGLTADVTGAWSNTGPSIEIVYQAGDAPASVAIASDVTWSSRRIAATHAWDRSVAAPGNAIGQPLLGAGAGAGALRLAKREKRVVQIDYDASAGAVLPALGDQVTITIPMPTGTRPVAFKVEAE